jgi:hypothetical protein
MAAPDRPAAGLYVHVLAPAADGGLSLHRPLPVAMPPEPARGGRRGVPAAPGGGTA